MATRFEMLLVGDDEEHLRAIGEAALDEISRVERLLSRFGSTSEVSRINRAAFDSTIRVDVGLFAILDDCRNWFERTSGYFDICATGEPNSPRFDNAVRLDPQARTIRFLDRKARLDFGGYGKGYALDAAVGMLDEFGVDSALLHGGTSSIFARGTQADGTPWRVGLRDPFSVDPKDEWGRFDLIDSGLSSSAAREDGSTLSDLIDPISRRPLDRQAACSVIAPTALEAEVLSTALLAMGKRRASKFVASRPGLRLVWIGEDEVERLDAGDPP